MAKFLLNVINDSEFEDLGDGHAIGTIALAPYQEIRTGDTIAHNGIYMIGAIRRAWKSGQDCFIEANLVLAEKVPKMSRVPKRKIVKIAVSESGTKFFYSDHRVKTYPNGRAGDLLYPLVDAQPEMWFEEYQEHNGRQYLVFSYYPEGRG